MKDDGQVIVICDSFFQQAAFVLLYNFSKVFYLHKWRKDQFSSKFIY